MGLEYTLIDAFTEKPFRGNPAVVFLLPEARPTEWMQTVASEMNQPETAFLVRSEDGYNLRWFTPAVEVDLAGHPTLASAHWLWTSGQLDLDTAARFHTRSGLLIAERHDDWIRLDFPATPAIEQPAPDGLAQALGAEVRWSGKSPFDLLAEVASEGALRALEPNLSAISRYPVRGVIVTAKAADPPYDFVSRFFAPQSGINEDPVTGSAHCCLGPYWSQKLGKTRLLAYQASARGGVVRLDVQETRVCLEGQAVTVATGRLLAG
ncbi:MAG: PhzF family phenazine biosynthesis protein [Acidobacteria bacterium]|nr:PhzF family phenazine biosynthesis protein [Acidobacteriota bacterium]MDA1234115.1 PhzF family phenazine biosynthesis protein [Acidobacteriota bacterium]